MWAWKNKLKDADKINIVADLILFNETQYSCYDLMIFVLNMIDCIATSKFSPTCTYVYPYGL